MPAAHTLDVSSQFLDSKLADSFHSTMAQGLVGSEILKIAADIRALKASGRELCNLTVGDFDPAQFRPPEQLVAGIGQALARGQTNYPPSDGLPELRKAVQGYCQREMGLVYPLDGILIAGGARPIIFGAYGTVIDPDDTVIYTVPSWNNNHYCHMVGAKGVALPVSREHNFFPTVSDLKPHLSVARLLVINSPLNPTGTAIAPKALAEITEALVAENHRREPLGQKPLFMLYDQVYWALTFGHTKHVTPVELVPKSAPYVIMLDAISKTLAATGLRVGWALAAPPLIARMRDYLGHVGAWAPKPEQVATAEFLDDTTARHVWQAQFSAQIKERLDAVYSGFAAMQRNGLPVECIEPQGAIYLSARFDLIGTRFSKNEEIRRFVLDQAGVGIVPFQAFGLKDETGWFRLSVGAVSVKEIQAMFPRLQAALAT